VKQRYGRCVENDMSELDPGILEGTVNANFKTIAEQPAQLANMMMQNSVANQQAAQGILTKSLGNTLAAMDRVGTTEALAIGGLTSKDMGALILTLAAAGKADVAPG
jgi:hypothetical protein